MHVTGVADGPVTIAAAIRHHDGDTTAQAASDTWARSLKLRVPEREDSAVVGDKEVTMTVVGRNHAHNGGVQAGVHG